MVLSSRLLFAHLSAAILTSKKIQLSGFVLDSSRNQLSNIKSRLSILFKIVKYLGGGIQ